MTRWRAIVTGIGVCASAAALAQTPGSPPPTGRGAIAFAASWGSDKACHRDAIDDCDLYLGDLDFASGAVSRIRVVDSRRGAQWFPSLSPDGRLLAYNESLGPRNRIVVVELPGLKEKRTLDGARFPAFSADSRRLFYSSNQSGIGVLDVDSGRTTVLPTQARGASDPFPVGDRYVVFHSIDPSGRAFPVMFDMTAGREIPLACPACGHPTANPAGTKVIAGQPGNPLIWMSELSNGVWSPFRVWVEGIRPMMGARVPEFRDAQAVILAYASWPRENLLVASGMTAEMSGGRGRPMTTTRSRLFMIDVSGSSPIVTPLSFEGHPDAQSVTSDVR